MADFLDTFTGTGGLGAHTSDSSNTWAGTTSTYTLSGSGTVYHTGAVIDIAYVSETDIPSGDSDIIFRCRTFTTSSLMGILFCYDNAAGDGYLFNFTGNASDETKLFRVDSGSFTNLGTITSSPNTAGAAGYTKFFKIEIRGNNLEFFSRNTTGDSWSSITTITDGNHRGAGLGLRTNNNMGASTGRHVSYFEQLNVFGAGEGGNIGLVTSTETALGVTPTIANPPPPWLIDATYPMSVSANGGVDTDTANLYINPSDTINLESIVVEANRAFSITPTFTEPVGLATETDIAFSMFAQNPITVSVEQALETDSANGIDPVLLVNLGSAVETDSGLSILPLSVSSLGVASETDEALEIVPLFSGQVGISTAHSTETALPISYQLAGDSTLTANDIQNIVNAIFSYIVENGETFEQQLRLIRAEAAGHLTVSGNQVGIRDAANTKDRITATTDINGQRTVVVTDPD